MKIKSHEKLDFLINYLLEERNEQIELPKDYESKRGLLRSLMNIRPPMPVSEEFLKVQDEVLSAETRNKKLAGVGDIIESKGKMMLWQGDITTLEVDAIVNAANSKLLGCFIPHHNCIDNIIHSSAGLQLRNECKTIMDMQGSDEKVGKAKITKAYNLPSKHVIHTVGPAIPQGALPSDNECEDLANCYWSCLEIADAHNLESIAFCGISTGIFNFPQGLAAQIAITAVRDYLKNNETSLKHIIFDTFTDESYITYKKLLFGD